MIKKTINPILFLVFNRLDTTKQTFSVIQKIQPPRLYISSDGPRFGVTGELEKVEIIRKYVISNVNWPCEIKTLFREKNLGCKLSVSNAIDWFFKHEEQGIILEDDCLPNTSFFSFCDELLEKYKNNKDVAVISGNNFNPNKIGNADYYFSKIPLIWGWATWRRTWNMYDMEMSNYLNFKKENKIKKVWRDKLVQNYWLYTFDQVYDNKINTWDYQLTFSIFLNNSLCICPNANLVSNIGFGKNSTNTFMIDKRLSNLKTKNLPLQLLHPNQPEYTEDNDYYVNKIFLNNFRIKKFLRKIGIFGFIKETIYKD